MDQPGFEKARSSYVSDRELETYVGERSDLIYLTNPSFHHYIKMHKVALGPSGSQELSSLADTLAQENMPRFIDAAASAYAEVGLFNAQLSAVERVKYTQKAEEQWWRASEAWQDISGRDPSGTILDAAEPHRFSLNVALIPMMKSFIAGNVTKDVLHSSLEKTVEIGGRIRQALSRAALEKNMDGVASYVGVLHEINALTSLMYLDDVRYMPLPATARADTGYYHREQTHDISIINHHWGEVRKVIPVEVKSKASLRDKRRYQALILRGKMHLTPHNVYDPRVTNSLYEKVLSGEASLAECATVEQMSTTVRELLRLYQQGVSAETVAMRSLTKFHDTAIVGKQYPELAKQAR